jgi:bifunctional ADP-heptose synthase (sugar kinase/adenylyltransferase)
MPCARRAGEAAPGHGRGGFTGAAVQDAAFLGNLAASVTIRKIGVTGTASPEEILAAHDSFISLKQETIHARKRA